jgi:hypothetical protein
MNIEHAFLGRVSGMSVKLTIHTCLVPKLKVCGTLPPLHQYIFMAFVLRNRKNFVSEINKMNITK